MKEPFVSVIIPVYNAEKYLDECLISVISQTLLNIEIVCVDDGSTDNSLSILCKYAEKDNRISVLRQENCGSGSARNKGLEVIKGEFVAFMDADDWYPNNDVLKNLYEAAIKNGVLICGGGLTRVSKGKVLSESKSISSKIIFAEEKLIDYKDYQFDYCYTRFIFNTKMLRDNKIFFPNYLRFVDPPFLVKAMVCAGKFYALNKVVYMYRTSHKKILWSAAKVCDILKGLIDNLEVSKQYSLDALHYLTYERLNNDYAGLITDQLHHRNKELVCLLTKANGLLDVEMLKRVSDKVPDSPVLMPLQYMIFTHGIIPFYVWNKVRRGIQCMNENGFLYTCRLFVEKVKRKFGM